MRSASIENLIVLLHMDHLLTKHRQFRTLYSLPSLGNLELYILYLGQSLLSLFTTQNGPIWARDAHVCGLGPIIPIKSSGLRRSDPQAGDAWKRWHKASKFSQLSRAQVHLIATCSIEEEDL
jgi:hypothetical protein